MPAPIAFSNYLIIIACVMVVAAGQVLFKLVGNRLGNQGFEALLHDYETAAILFTALALYGISTLGWILALRSVPLSSAYLFMSLSFVIVPALAWYFFGDTITPKFMIGAALIVAGIMVVSTS